MKGPNVISSSCGSLNQFNVKRDISTLRRFSCYKQFKWPVQRGFSGASTGTTPSKRKLALWRH